MAIIFAKQEFTLNKGEKRIPWRYEGKLNDDDVLNFILKDDHFSKENRWKNVFDVLSFDKAENNEKYKRFLAGSNKINITNTDVAKNKFVDNGKAGSKTEVRNFGGNRFNFDKQKKINEFIIMNDFERDAIVDEFLKENDIAALSEIQENLMNRGRKQAANDIAQKIENINRKKSAAVAENVKKEMQEAVRNR